MNGANLASSPIWRLSQNTTAFRNSTMLAHHQEKCSSFFSGIATYGSCPGRFRITCHQSEDNAPYLSAKASTASSESGSEAKLRKSPVSSLSGASLLVGTLDDCSEPAFSNKRGTRT